MARKILVLLRPRVSQGRWSLLRDVPVRKEWAARIVGTAVT